MFQRSVALFTLFSAFTVSIFAQGLDTRASKDDWEEINFEFNSSVLSDGFPSLLRLADLLKAHTGYRVRLEGHADHLGSDRYNDKLGMQRANTVRDFLVKYGAAANQIETLSRGEKDPKVPGEKSRYSKTDVARWMNRRVAVTVLDEQGRTVGAGGIGDAIAAMPAKPARDCCDEILKRLDRLDDIAKMLRDMADQNAGLRKELDNLKQQQAALQNQINSAPKPLTQEQTAKVVDTEIAKNRDPRFSLLGINIGEDSYKHVTFSGRARFFAPFKEHFAIQAQGEYFYFNEAREGQFDLGLVDRMGSVQAGLFSSFKHVSMRQYQTGGTLGQGALTLDYIFRLGKVGVFGTKSFLDNQLMDSRNAGIVNGSVVESCAGQAPGTCGLAPNLYFEKYLRVVDQVGVSGTVGLWKNNYLEANFGYLRSRANADRPGGTVRFIFPFRDRLAFTVEGGMNETLVTANNWGRAVVGLQFGNFLRPREFQGVDHPVPVDVPRVRYEVATVRARRGVAPPVADAGPDQIGVPSGTITLNGSGSYDPNGEKLTYQWVAETGNVAISGANQPVATFTAADGMTYSFRLTVRNESGLTASARTRVTTTSPVGVQILFFIANPPTINQGQSSILSWQVLNATTVTIGGIGNVQAQGTASVSPQQTTTYTLMASNATSQATATATVMVQIPTVTIANCMATPTNINQGESATISFTTMNATSVTVNPSVPGVGTSGSFVVSPAANTTYTITAMGASGSATATCSVGLIVNPPKPVPRIVRFTGDPTSIIAGEKSTLTWAVENADTVTITPTVGTVPLSGNRDVMPTDTTIYTLTATNANGTSTAMVTITVGQPARITSFTANPPVSSGPGQNVVLSCQATNATSVTIAGAGPLGASGTIVVNPTVDTTYTCTAVGVRSQDTKTVLVKVTQKPVVCPGDPSCPQVGPPPTVVIAGGPVLETVVRTVTLDASQSFSPGNFTPLKYFWTAREGRAAIANANSPTPIVYLGELYGDYFFDVTVTDARGNVSTGSIDVRLVVTRIP